jgi:hypothetical protein
VLADRSECRKRFGDLNELAAGVWYTLAAFFLVVAYIRGKFCEGKPNANEPPDMVVVPDLCSQNQRFRAYPN